MAHVTADGEANPLGVDVPRPRLAWVLSSRARDERQTAYRVLVATSPAKLRAGEADVWDSGKVRSAASTGVAYGGPALRSATRYYWTVRVWDAEGRPSPWSKPARWEMGLLTTADWSGARWIGQDNPAADPSKDLQWTWNYPAQLTEGHTLGQSFTVDGLFSGVCGVFPNWVTTGSGMTLTLRAGGPDGQALASTQLTDVPNNATRCLTFDALPAGTYYLEMSDPVATIGWWSHSDDLLAGGQAYADGKPVAGDRSLQIRVPTPPAPLLRKGFSVAKDVKRARVYVSGLGYYVLSIDGRRVGNSVLDPGFTVYDKTALYATYDVTSALRAHGPHALGVALGRGFYGLPSADTLYWGNAPWLGDPRLRLELRVDYTDGTHATVDSDTSWRVHGGPTTRDSIYMGENYDARLLQPGWDRPGFDGTGWEPASEMAAPTSNLRSQRMQPIRVVDTMRAERITNPKPGTYVFKFPVMTAGWARLRVAGPTGTQVTLRYGETLRADGTVDNDGDSGLTTGPIQTDRYTLSGHGTETWEPSFSYKGFQYVQVNGYPGVPTADDVVARVVHSDVPSTGRFSSSDPLLNTIHAMSRRTILNNLHSILTDTPMFEKRGWLDDASILAPTTIDNFGMRRFYRNWLTSIRDNQGADGAGVELSPSPLPAGYTEGGPSTPPDPIWAGAIVLLPWELYREYGDRDVLAESYEAMVRYVEYMRTQGDGLIQPGFYGDWASPNPIVEHTTAAFMPPEGPSLTATAYYYEQAVLTAKAARVLKHGDDAARLTALADDIKAAFNARFLDRDAGVYHTDEDVGYRQTSNAVPLTFGLVPSDMVDEVARNLVADVRAHGNHLNTGDAGTKELLPALTENGHVDTAFAIATQRTYPSWGFIADNGGTTLWERWRTSTRSRDHAFFGTIDDWFYRYLAGIQPEAAGYARIAIRPHLPSELDHAAASVDTVHGTVASAWRKTGKALHLDVTVPVNATATVHVPLGGDRWVAADNGAKPLRVRRDEAVYEVGSGRWRFVSHAGR